MTASETFTNGETRVVWYYDECYQTEGSYGYDTEEETRAAEQEEIKNLESGKWTGPYMVSWERLCPACKQWETTDTVGGVILDHYPTETDDADFR